MELDSNTLFVANTIILVVMALAFLSAHLSREREQYWLSWTLANISLAAALLIIIFEASLPPFAVGTGAHALLLLGFGLCLKAAREFSRRSPLPIPTYGPTLFFAVFSLLPFIATQPGLAFTVVNILLAAVTALVAYEFWRDRADRLPSRYGICAAYLIMAGSFGMRATQGLIAGWDFVEYLPRDQILTLHLTIALVHTVGSGAFAISIAYERGAVQLRRDARSDSLTGLLNRRAFEEQMQAVLDKPEQDSFCLILLDIDHFKHVNDQYGHAVGDEALRACACVFRKTLRANDVVARIGGEEFAAMLENIRREEALVIAERIRKALGDLEVMTTKGPIRITLSAGLHFSSNRSNFDAILQAADAALYRAKRNGRNRIEMAT
ncbi:GGDEF domain-containing protein [Pelagibacterium lentulum]|uniref:diguanylate cyclase n=1 Tax=Pelagibacterium lentulum TaxID=2029865 RepID=A0A916RBQ1_9HYPH|nr:GGDEF domain-containing protein [Pelagibacterium lentulum]GGA49334.1 GGDEF domain-containing protein [Pelagibacterium lentulum]